MARRCVTERSATGMDPGINIAFDYDPELIAALKDAIHPVDRAWMPDIRRWWVRSEVIWIAMDILASYCGTVVGDPYDHAPPPPGPSSAPAKTAFTELHLLPTAPAEVITAAYRALCRIHHPDKGGREETMKAINAAYDKLKKP